MSGPSTPTRVRFRTPTCPAFTLIELLVVISVIALLIALLLPALSRARMQAKVAVCQSNTHQWGIICSMYTTEHDGRLLPPTIWWFDAIRRYSDDYPEALNLCPAATKCEGAGDKTRWTEAESPSLGHRKGGKFSAWWCVKPESMPTELISGGFWLFRCSYGASAYVGEFRSASSPSNPADVSLFLAARRKYWTRSNLKNPGTVPFLFDCAEPVAHPRETDAPPAYEGDFTRYGTSVWEAGHDAMKELCFDRHGNGSLSMAFLDGSARRVGLKELWTLKWHTQYDPSGPWTKVGGALPSDWPEWMRKFKDY